MEMLDLEKEKNRICEEAIKTWGLHSQELMAIEEMAELIQILIRKDRGNRVVLQKEIISEIADVNILMKQLEIAFNCTKELKDMETKKLIKLEGYIKESRKK